MPATLVVGGQLGNYLIESVIGRGGMSVVYRAQHIRLGTPVALKVLAPELSSDDTFRERFLREAKMAAGIDHPNVIPIYDTGLQDDSLYIVMRNVAGGDLKALLRQSGPMDPKLAVAILTPIAKALDAAHAHGLVHRDVKPANILLQRSASGEVEHVYLTDFGITKHATSVSGLTGTGAMIGTIDYMAPEQIEDDEISARTDVYALACVLYQCLTGQLPFARDSNAAVLFAHIRDPIEPPSTIRPGLTTALDAVLAKALAKAPADRYESCEEFTRACAAALAAAEAPAPAEDGDPLYEATLTSARVPSVPSAPPPPEAQREPAAAAPARAASAPVASDGPPGAAGDAAPTAGGWLTRHWWQVALLVVVVGGAIAAGVTLLSGSSSSPSSPAPTSGTAGPGGVPAALKPVPTNRVTGRGRARVRLRSGAATVSISISGLLNGAPHAMHIHAGAKGVCPPASAARRHAGHLAISTTNGGAFYGGAVTALTTRGDTSVGSILAFSRFPVTGNVTYDRSIELPAAVVNLIRQGNAVIVIHGIDYNHNGIYDGVLDRSELNRKYFGETTAPALCGSLVPGAGGARASLRTDETTRNYTASLTLPADPPSGWICSLGDPTSGTRQSHGLIA